MNRLTTEKRRAVVAALVEGNSIRATCRMTGIAKGTVLKLLGDLGRACQEYQDGALRGLKCRRAVRRNMELRWDEAKDGRSQGPALVYWRVEQKRQAKGGRR